VPSSDPSRPAPDAPSVPRAKLKIFLGAAPGVGKTLEMLREGATRRRAGLDVVIGAIETHGRADIEALARRFETVPRHVVERDGRRQEEADLDAIVARAPALVLMDDLAHVNAPGSRHPRRWQDVEELLAAGIDVATTLNVQHIESLTDVAAQFSRVQVAATVPDALVDRADIELIDLPPDEIVERLKEGKVHVPEEVSRVLAHYFSRPNLSALRELALRRAALAVDAQLEEMEGVDRGIRTAGERVLVAVSELPGSETLVRAAKRLADALRAPWTALHVETPRTRALGEEAQTQLAHALQLAASLGATLATVPATNVAEGIRAQLAEMGATQLVIGKSQRSWWFTLRHGSVVNRLLHGFAGVAIHVIPSATRPTSPPGAAPAEAAPRPPLGVRLRDYGIATGMVALTTLAALGLVPIISAGSVDMLYLLPVIAAATLFGIRVGLLASLLSALAYGYFFLEPLHTLIIRDAPNIATLLVLAAVAMVASRMAGRLRSEATIGARSARENASIAAFAQQLAIVSKEKDTAGAICAEVSRLLGVDTVLLARRDGVLVMIEAAPPRAESLGPVEMTAAEWAFDHGEPTGRDTSTLAAADWQFHPLKTSLGTMAVLGLVEPRGRTPVPPDRAILLATLIGQAALAYERVRLEGDMREVTVAGERNRLRAALISSIGDDVRVPLTAVIAAADALDKEEEGPPDPALLGTLRVETRRLSRFLADIVDMSRVEAGALNIAAEPTDLVEAVAAAAHDLRATLDPARIVLDIPPDLPRVSVDQRLLNHMLVNLIDNAQRHGGGGAPITLEGRRVHDGITLAVLDEGPGLRPDQAPHIFEGFLRGEKRDRGNATGLGLAIVKGLADAMDIAVSATNRANEGGARFTLHFPETLLVPATPDGESEDENGTPEA